MMTKLTLRGFWAHKHRFIGAATAVFLGVAFLTGTLIVSDTLSSGIDRFFQQAYSGTDVVVRNATQVTTEPNAPRGTIASSILSRVSAVPGVAAAEPVIQGSGQLLDKSGNVIQTRGPSRAGNWVNDPKLNPYHIVAGHAPQASGQILIDQQTAQRYGFQVGNTAIVLTPQRISVTIVGIVKFGSAAADGATSYVGMTLSDAQRYLVTTPGQVSSISVKAAAGVSPTALRQRIAAILPSGTEAITGQALAQENFDSVNQGFLTLFRTFLVVFAGVALVVSLFSMFNTFSIVVSQRTRDSALLRAIGASRRQVLWSVVIEGLTVGVLASIAGFAAGIGVAAILERAFRAGLGIPVRGLTLTLNSALVAIGAGIVVTLLACLRPAAKASRIPPIAALRDAELEPTNAPKRGAIIGSLLLTIGIITIAGAATIITSSRALPLVGVGAFALVVGVIALSPATARLAGTVLGSPIAQLRGVSGRLARGNATRSPQRTGRAATALFLGVGVVTVFTILIASLSSGLGGDLNQTLAANLVVASGNLPSLGFNPQLAQQVQSLPSVAQATGIATGSVLINGKSSTISAVTPDQVGGLVHISVTSGLLSTLSGNQLGVSSSSAAKSGWKLGSLVTVTFANGTKREFSVGAIYQSNAVLNDYVMPAASWFANTAQPRDSLLLVKLQPGVSPSVGKAAVSNAAQAVGAPPVQTRAEYTKAQTSMLGTILDVAYGLLAFAIIIALMSIGNTLSLSIYERTRELGLLHAVGASAEQLRSMVRWESIIVAVFGTASGLLVGVFVGWGLAEAISRTESSTFTLPGIQLVVILVVGALAGVLASIRPARRAARLDILAAIATE